MDSSLQLLTGLVMDGYLEGRSCLRCREKSIIIIKRSRPVVSLKPVVFSFNVCVFVLKITLTNLVSVNERLVYTPHPENPEK